ncbi:MAG: hypothetical protein AAF570_25320, partial [Bacteroidota bacterium]
MIRSNARLLIFAIIAVVITAGSLLYSNQLAKQLLEQEERSMSLYAKGMEFAGDLEPMEDCEVQWIMQNVITANDLIPTILVLNGNINSVVNLPLDEELSEAEIETQKREFLVKLQNQGSPKPLV